MKLLIAILHLLIAAATLVLLGHLFAAHDKSVIARLDKLCEIEAAKR